MRKKIMILFAAIFLQAALWAANKGETGKTSNEPALHVAGIFTDNMVLQRDCPVPVWGWTVAGEKVNVSFHGKNVEATAGKDGRWQANLPPMPADSSGAELKVSSPAGSISISNVLVGDVWLCSGQSNMKNVMKYEKHFEEENPKADIPTLRLFEMPELSAFRPLSDIYRTNERRPTWQTSRSGLIQNWPSIPYYFGKELSQRENVPVGAVVSAWGNTPIEAWLGKECFLPQKKVEGTDEKFAEAMGTKYGAWAKAVEAAPGGIENFTALNLKWQKDYVAKKRNKDKDSPVDNPDDRFAKTGPTGAYNAMIAPLIPFALRGVLWYQGESNASRACAYKYQLSLLIRTWRDSWKSPELPFLIVQLPNYRKLQEGPNNEALWAELREAQAETAAAVPNTSLVVAMGLGEADQIHPKNKKELSKRATAVAQRALYGRDILCSGPVFENVRKEGGKLRLSFTSAGNGLITADGKKPEGFEIAGDDRKFFWANAVIDGSCVILSCPDVREPVAARYAWADNPVGNLENREGLPATSFRTDKWPLASEKIFEKSAKQIKEDQE